MTRSPPRPATLPRSTLLTQIALWLSLLGLCGAAAWMAWTWRERVGRAQLDEAAARRLDLYTAVLENELGKHAYLPGLLAADRDVQGLLLHPEAAERAPEVNRLLARFSASSGAANTFVLDASGRVVASGDSYRPDSVWGRDLSGHPRFADALGGQASRFFAPDARSGAPEYHVVQPVVREGRVLGAVGVRISLAAMEATWTELTFRAESEKPLVADEDGVVILSSVPAWRFKTTAPLNVRTRARLESLYPGRDLSPLPMDTTQPSARDVRLVRLAMPPGMAPAPYALHERGLERFGWRLMVLSDASEVTRSASEAAGAAAAVSGFAGLLLLHLRHRRRASAQRLTALNAELLAETNRELQREIGERRHAEAVLRQAQEGLVQAEKLALLGQMSAGISHEIGQPLTALLALSENARLLLARGRSAQVEENLVAINAMAARLGRITGQLKSYARKPAQPAGPVSLDATMAGLHALLQARLQAAGVQVHCLFPEGLRVECDASRLEQVLVNLAANAIDAMRGSEVKELRLEARTEGPRAIVRVSDTGPGIPADTRAHLFEPFFTTKPDGEGLGLGLVISANIVKEFGGTLRPVPCEGGAAFEFDLPLAPPAP